MRVWRCFRARFFCWCFFIYIYMYIHIYIYMYVYFLFLLFQPKVRVGWKFGFRFVRGYGVSVAGP